MVITSPLSPTNSTFEMHYTFEAHFSPFKRGVVHDVQFGELLRSLYPGSGYYLCEGIPKQVIANVTFNVNNLRLWTHPLDRADHQNCLTWFQPGKVPLNLKYGLRCVPCSKLHCYLVSEIGRRKKVDPVKKVKRVLPSSKCPFKYLSPASKEKRHELTRLELSSTKRKVLKYERYDVNVGDASNEELTAIAARIHHKSQSELQCLLSEADRAEKGDILRAKWKQDVEDRITFDRDQHKNGT